MKKDKIAKNIEVFPDRSLLSHRGAELFKALLQSNINSKSVFRTALAGGSTPVEMYKILANKPFRSQIEWGKVDIFFGDERLVPLNHADSNFCMANETLLKNISIPKTNIHPVPVSGDKTPDEIACEYETEIRNVFKIYPPDFPVFDLIILGMGKDGHIASLFPETDALQEETKLVVATYPPQYIIPNVPRVTLTLPVILQAKQIIVLIAGKEKAETLRKLFYEEYRHAKLPIQFLLKQPNKVKWLLDIDASPNL